MTKGNTQVDSSSISNVIDARERFAARRQADLWDQLLWLHSPEIEPRCHHEDGWHWASDLDCDHWFIHHVVNVEDETDKRLIWLPSKDLEYIDAS